MPQPDSTAAKNASRYLGENAAAARSKRLGIAEDISRMVTIRLFWCAIAGAVGQRFKRGRGSAHKA